MQSSQDSEQSYNQQKPPKRQYFDSLAGLALGKRGDFVALWPLSLARSRALRQNRYAQSNPSYYADVQEPVQLEKRQYFDSLYGGALGKRAARPPFDIFEGNALGKMDVFW